MFLEIQFLYLTSVQRDYSVSRVFILVVSTSLRDRFVSKNSIFISSISLYDYFVPNESIFAFSIRFCFSRYERHSQYPRNCLTLWYLRKKRYCIDNQIFNNRANLTLHIYFYIFARFVRFIYL